MPRTYKTFLIAALLTTIASGALARSTDVPMGGEAGGMSGGLQVMPGRISDLKPDPSGLLRTRIAQSDAAVLEQFTWSAGKTATATVFEGQAPNAAIKSFLVAKAGTEAEDNMSVAAGGPNNFTDYALAGVDALVSLVDGRVSFTGSKWTLGGHVSSQEDLEAIVADLGDKVDLDDWVVFLEVAVAETAMTEESPAAVEETVSTANLLSWSVHKSADGALSFDGTVPSAALQNYLRIRGGESATDNTSVGGQAPDDFIGTAIAAVEAVKDLDQGRVAFTGTKWTIGGFAPSRAVLDDTLKVLGRIVDLEDWLVFVEITPMAESEVAEVVDLDVGDIEADEAEIVEMAEADTGESDPTTNIPDFQFNALKADGGDIALSGDAPNAGFARYAAVVAGVGGEAGNALSINEHAPVGFAESAVAGLRALSSLESGLLAFENGGWTLVGDSLTDAEADAVTAAVSGLPGGDAWTLDVAVLPVFELCATAVAEFSDTHTILFAPASSNLAPESAAALFDLADELSKCNGARLNVEGHTDADGPDDSNMALSVARSESVIAELVRLGLDDTRLYAIGYGETLPVTTNDTAAGKAQNRRIVFELVRE